jgi:single-stranded-DNA-specific exonuclease
MAESLEWGTGKRWLIPEALPADVDRALARFTPGQRQVLYARGIDSEAGAARFLSPPELSHADPFLLAGMHAAVERLERAAVGGEEVAVYGDFDADGVTATRLLVEAFERAGLRATEYIPNRFDEGYGLHADALATLRDEGIRLVVTVDCGVRSIEEARAAAAMGLDLIITDHHQPGPDLPPAMVVIDPKQPADVYPFKDLSGVGLAYRLAQALLARWGRPEPTDLLELVAVGTVADLVELKDENRGLVHVGLRRLNGAPRPGLAALIEEARLRPGKITAASIAFALGPRLNAAGRLASAQLAYDLLAAQDRAEASLLAARLGRLNEERQQITRETVERARALGIGAGAPPSLIFVADESFNEGVIGLAAARLVDEFYRPAIVARRGAEYTRGSARSIPEVHITEALDSCSDLLVRYGGHKAAAGFTLRTSDLETLLERLHRFVEDRVPADLSAALKVDAVIDIGEVGGGLLEFVEGLEPCGYGNPLPLFVARSVRVVRQRVVGADQSHLKLDVQAGRRTLDAIGFRMGHLAGDRLDRVDLAFRLERNSYQSVDTIQLNIQDIRSASG